MHPKNIGLQEQKVHQATHELHEGVLCTEAPTSCVSSGLMSTSDVGAALREQGYAYLTTRLEAPALRDFILDLGTQLGRVVPTRGTALVDELRPRTREQAHRKSLSALTGIDEQPWHMDGAHLKVPYRYILLASPAHDAGKTRTAICSTKAWAKGNTDDLGALVFGYDTGRSVFLDTIKGTAPYLRFDPGCMRPSTEQAKALLNSLAYKAVSDQKEFEWYAGTILVIDNWKTLHRRRAISGFAERLLYRVSVM